MRPRVSLSLAMLLVTAGHTAIGPGTAAARPDKRSTRPAPIIQAYGAWGRLPSTGDHRSPDRRYILRATHHDGDTTNVAIVDAKSGRQLASIEDVGGFLWVPGKNHRAVIAALGIYGKAMLVMWEGGRRLRSLHRVRRPGEEHFCLYGVTPDGKILIYGYDSGRSRERLPLDRQRGMRLPD